MSAAAPTGAPTAQADRPLGLSPATLQALLCVAGVSCCVAMSMPQVHIVAYCTDLGFGAARGAEMLSVMLGMGEDGHTASLLIVAARTAAGVSLFAVDGDGAGVTRTPLATMDQTRKQAKVATAQAAFIEQHPGLIERLRKEAEWNSFAGEMLQKFNQWQSLTDRQIAACAAMFAKIDAKRAEKQAAKSASTGEVNIAAIEAMFSKARDSGLNKLAFRAGGLTISPAKESSRNAGALYVKRGDTYMGKILGGKFLPVSSATPDVLETIRTIAANPPEAAREYGRKTGICCCCGRELTDPESMAAGIGPVCATKWGL